MGLLGRFQSFPLAALLLLLLLLQAPSQTLAADNGAPAAPPGNFDEWTGFGGNVYNNRWNYENSQINSTSVGQLTQNCKLDYPGGVAATPVIVNFTAYYPTINGSFYALDYVTCQYEWQINVTQLIWDFQVPSAPTLNHSIMAARTSPQIDPNAGILYFGTQALALLIAVDLKSGRHLATTQVNDHPLAICTMSPTLYGGKIFIGASSHEDAGPNDPSYQCCSFIGNFAAFTFDRTSGTFTKAWEVKTLPEGQGWAGAGVWGPGPPVDPVRNQIFFGTGQIMAYPDAYTHCKSEGPGCLPGNVWQDSIVAVDVNTGNMNWRYSTSPLDDWLQICGPPNQPTSKSPLCPGSVGPDSDFGMAPAFVPAALGEGPENDSIVAGQKNGNICSLNAATGAVQWTMHIGGSTAGSWLSWGLAVDASRVYYTALNYAAMNWTLTPSGAVVNNSAWGALDLKTGAHIWETAVPDNRQLAYAPPGVVNDLVFVGAGGSSTVRIPGSVNALSLKDGSIVKTLPVASVQDGGIVARGGFVLFGTGYAYRNPFNAGSFYVYALPEAIVAAKAAEITRILSTATAMSLPPTLLPQNPIKKNGANRMERSVTLTAIYTASLLAVVIHSIVDGHR
jgi:outer membrane protein assembly factor BamB